MKKNTTAKAFAMSVLALMVCLSMLVGTTFAWFTDSVTSGVNKIVAGNLDVELEYAKVPVGTAPEEDDWKTVQDVTDLFMPTEGEGSTLWEPGHTEYVYLRIRNAGTLALKYQFAVNVYGDEAGGAEKEYTNKDGGKFRLSDYLVFNQIDGAAAVSSREELWLAADKEADAMGDLSGLGAEDILLLPDMTKELTLAVYMPTSVGNEANYKTGTDIPTIFLGLDLTATQTPHESDSFDDQYDKEAPVNTYYVDMNTIQEYLDGKHGSMTNAKLVLAPGDYGNLVIGAPSKYAEGDTVYTCMDGNGHSGAPLSFTDAEAFKAHVSDGKWHAVPRYTRTIDNLTLVGQADVQVAGITISSGHMYGDTIWDPVLEKGSQYYLAQDLSNLTFRNIKFTARVNIATSNPDTQIDGVTFETCRFMTTFQKQGIRYYNESNNGKVRNLVVTDCDFFACYQGIYASNVNGITVTGCGFDRIGHNAIALQSGVHGAVNYKAVVIENNRFFEIHERVIRFGDIAADTRITMRNNRAVLCGDENKEVVKAQSLAPGITYDIGGNDWRDGIVVNPELRDQAP